MKPDDPVLGISCSTADMDLRKAAREAGFGSQFAVSHHDLRRTFGRLAHEAGMDLVQLRYLLGHSSIDMTVHYIGLDSARMREGLGKFAEFTGTTPGRDSRWSPGVRSETPAP